MKILVECFPDEALLRSLGIPARRLLHYGGKGEVIKNLRERPSDIGMIDEDPNSYQPRDLSHYGESQAGEGLRLLVRRGKGNQKLIVVCPRLEEWLIGRARSSGIKPEKYNLPANPNHLKSMVRYDKRRGYSQFLADLNDCDPGMRRLRDWVLS